MINIINRKMPWMALIIFMAFFTVYINTGIKSDVNADEKTMSETDVDSRISLEIASIINQPSTLFAFTIKNNSDKEIGVYPCFYSWNELLLLNPKGEIMRERELVEGPPIIIEPKETTKVRKVKEK